MEDWLISTDKSVKQTQRNEKKEEKKTSFKMQLTLPLTANKQKLKEVFESMKTDMKVIKDIQMEVNKKKTNINCIVEFNNCNSLTYCCNTIQNHQMDNVPITAKYMFSATHNNKNKIHYQYPFEYDKKYFTK